MTHFAILAALASSPAKAVVSSETVRAAIETLSSDEFEGRAPASKGEKLSIDYIARRFKELGLRPGNPDGSYFQKVPMTGATVTNTDAKMTFLTGASTSSARTAASEKMELSRGDDYMAFSKRPETNVAMDAPMIFAGYGVQAPEYGWDDFKDVDVRGKVIVVLINDPPVPDPKDPTKLDPNVFGGKAMTYYGRWTYKFEKAAELGAAGCIIVHETEPAAYPWEVVRNSWGGEGFDLESPENAKRAAVEAWITRERAVELFKKAGLDFEKAKADAVRRDFRPVDLHATASLKLTLKRRRIESANVVGRLEGADPKLKDEYVVYTAHWDHFGARQGPKGREIFHGAVDNASGVGGLLALAEAFKKMPARPRRSILFLATTGEEQGLLGSRYYAENPLYPIEKTVAVLNMDSLNVLGPTKDVTVIGYGQSRLDDLVEKRAAEQGRVARPDPEPEKGGFYRSDHLSFAKKGVPSLFLTSGVDYVGKPEGWGLKARADFEENRYHKPADVILPDWDLAGTALDLDVLLGVGLDAANADPPPDWKPKSEFASLRKRS